MTQPFLYNWPQGSGGVQQESRVYTQPNPAVIDDAGAAVPVSTNYGLNFQITNPAL